jgi:hypothetical protein
MKYQLPVVFVLVLCLAPLPAAAQTPTGMKVVPIGQLNGPILRQMTATFCGPFFTMVPTDASGGGFVNLAIETPEDVEVVSFPVKAIYVKFCDSCEAPQFKQSGDDNSIRGELTISHDQLKISPCLKSAKVPKG